MEYEYNETGIRTEACTYNSEDKLIARTVYTVDEKERLIELFEEDQFHKTTTTFAYDDKDNMIEQLETNKAGELNSRIIRKFDENNNLLEVAVTIDRHGVGYNQNYVVHYEYEYFA
jgi:YD repeat-containing protein